MRLKRLEMVGFKSFADKTRIEFEPGVTAIVGPNGCGKSNISDAIRWALGEMSAKTLRSQQMLDVIFNGTANRPAQGLSEVSLTFDNASHQINIDYSEVSVCRRLFRSGESEYSINKTQCRLKDIRDLFLDTGIGSEGYYVLAQGKIEFILSSKPEERRELFEEAAGVSKYKVRREEALRRLGKVEQDMLRLNDSLAIYKQQIDALDSAVRKARTHQKLQEEMRTLDIAGILHSLNNLEAHCQETQSRHQEESQRLAQLKEELAQEETAIADERKSAETLEQRVLDLQRESSQMESDIARNDAECIAAQEREGELKTAQVRLQDEIHQLSSTLAERQNRHVSRAKELEELKAVFELKNATYQEESNKGQSEIEACSVLQKKLQESKNRILELARMISHHRNENVRLTSFSIRNDEAVKSKNRELEKALQRREPLAGQIVEQEKQVAESLSRLTVIEQSLVSLDEAQKIDGEKLLDMEQTIQSSKERLARLEAEKISLERWLSQDPVALASEALRQNAVPGVYGPVGTLFRTSEPYQRLLDRALGDRADYFVADSLNDAQAAIRFLSDERKGWATFLVLDRLVQNGHLAPEAAQGNRTIAQDVECEEKFRPVLDYLIGNTFYVGATIFEESLIRGGADPLVDSYQAKPSDLGRLLQEIIVLKETLEATQSARDGVKTAMAGRDEERAPLQAELSNLQVSFQVQQESLSRLREDHKMILSEEQIIQREIADLQQTIQNTQAALQKEETLLHEMEAEEKSLQQSMHEQDSSLQALRQSIQAHQEVVSQLRVDAETSRERLNGMERDAQNAEAEITSLGQRIKSAETQFAENDQRISQLGALQAERTALLETLRASRENQQSTLNSLTAERRQVQETLRRREQELSGRREALAEAQTRAQEAEFQVRSLDQERSHLQTTLKESHQLSVEEASAHYKEVQANPDELARIKRRLESLGPVNLAAPEEHAQLEERYHFLLTQQQDLLKAKDDLYQAIQKINATTREHFKTTYEQVRQNFKNLYQQLFQGGEADLVLTDEHNLLETGIDIVAQPPGKKLQNIALLSGGEKAMTAIALLFAFFLVKPSPFCLLDEVDAPLDEANVGRFLEMVKAFAQNTQFIVITHNKRTMELANVLYGVTMADLGISSLISVKLQGREEVQEAAAV